MLWVRFRQRKEIVLVPRSLYPILHVKMSAKVDEGAKAYFSLIPLSYSIQSFPSLYLKEDFINQVVVKNKNVGNRVSGECMGRTGKEVTCN